MGCASSRSKVIEKVIETETTLVQKETTLASVLEAIPFLLSKIPKDVVHISVLSYLSYEPEALSDQNINSNIFKYFSNYDEMFDVFVRHGSIDNWNISEITNVRNMNYVPEFMALYEILPYIDYSPLDDETIRVAVKDYDKCGKKKDDIIKKYGKIEDWNTSEVTDMSKLPLESHISKRYKNSQVKKFDKKFRHNKTRGRNRKMHR